MLNYFPKYFTDRAIIIYLIALIAISFFFMDHVMVWYGFVFGIIAVVCFFYFSNRLTQKWSQISSKIFIKKIFWTSFFIRFIWVVFSYFFYIYMTGIPFEFGAADSFGYHQTGLEIANNGLRANYWGIFKAYYNIFGVSDSGYISYLGVVYFLFDDSIFIARLLKVLYSAFTCVLIYKLTLRTAGDNVARIAAIFFILMPNLIYYCGVHVKETEMLFLTVAFMERADHAMRSSKLSFSNLILPVLLAGILFFFRTILGAAALFSFITALVFSNKQTFKKGTKRVILIAWVFLAVAFFMGGRISAEVEQVWEARKTNQSDSMEWRSNREGGNLYAKYGSAAIFAPMILIIPFPTMISVTTQYSQQLLHGGYYVKNVMAFFAIFALIWMLKNKKWRDYILIEAFTLGYLVIVAFSAFAHSERFHLPVLPFILILSAFGVSKVTNKTKKYYMFYLAFLFVALIGWSWFKLAGRGLV